MVSNMYMKTKVYLVRHAQPNLDNHDDFSRELSPKGLEDRKRVTEFLSDKNIDVVYSSPFKRAVDTIADFADSKNKKINIVDEFRERKVGDYWLDDFTAFTKNQWKDFNYKLPDGECLKEVQERNITALKEILERHPGEKIVIGSHGTAMSTIINYYDSSFGYEDFEKIKGVMPWLVEIVFDENKTPVSINKFNII